MMVFINVIYYCSFLLNFYSTSWAGFTQSVTLIFLFQMKEWEFRDQMNVLIKAPQHSVSRATSRAQVF